MRYPQDQDRKPGTWTTGMGQVIRIADMGEQHLANTIRWLQHAAQRRRADVELDAESFAASMHGDMASYHADGQAHAISTMDDDDFCAFLYGDTWRELTEEAERRRSNQENHVTNLRKAAAEIQKAKKVTRSTWEDSTYRQRIEQSLTEALTDLGEVEGRLDRAAKFFKPEWEARSQKFLKRFVTWGNIAAKTSQVLVLRDFTRFGGKSKINVADIANKLNVSFSVVLFQVLRLVARGLARRVEPFFDNRGNSVFNLHAFDTNYLHFFLQAEELLEEFGDGDLHQIAEHLFFPEIGANKAAVDEAIRLIRGVAVVAGQRSKAETADLCRKLRDYLQRPVGPYTDIQLARVMQAPLEAVRFCLLLLATFNENNRQLRRVPPYSIGANGHTFKVGYTVEEQEAPVAVPAPAKTVEIATMGPQEAKDFLQRAALAQGGPMAEEQLRAQVSSLASLVSDLRQRLCVVERLLEESDKPDIKSIVALDEDPQVQQVVAQLSGLVAKLTKIQQAPKPRKRTAKKSSKKRRR